MKDSELKFSEKSILLQKLLRLAILFSIVGYFSWVVMGLSIAMVHKILLVGLLCVLSVLLVIFKSRIDKLEEVTKYQEDRVNHLKYYDQLTELPNPFYFKERMRSIINSDFSGSILFADVENVQFINSFYGTDVADEILRSIGGYYGSKPGDEYMISYLGNNTFAFLYDRILPKESVELMIAYNCDQINSHLNLPIRVKMNYVCIPDVTYIDNYDSMIAIIDDTMLVIKPSSSYLYYFEKDSKLINSDSKFTSIVRDAIEKKLYTVYYQEKVDSNTNDIFGLEALARLPLDDKIISPGEFIPIIEHNKKSIEFGWVIIEKVFKDYTKIISQYFDGIIISINISADHFADKEFVSGLNNLINQYKIPANYVELEITESMVIKDFKALVKRIDELRAQGIRISIDDFGTGYSSLQYFHNLPIDVVKIDKSFIDDLAKNSVTKAIVKAIIDISLTAHFEVVAEGVEEAYQMEILKELGCSKIQGYLYSKPKPLI